MNDGLVNFLRRKNLIIYAGMETKTPHLALERYLQALEESGYTVQGKRVLIFGYGGSFALGCMLLQQGAAHTVLCDKYAQPDIRYNHKLLPEYAQYLQQTGRHLLPKAEYLTLLQEDIRITAQHKGLEPVDLVVSNSVFEHLDDVDGVANALASLTTPTGVHVHYIDMRDHFFKYPFEMLTYSENAWQKWLNPGSHLNRFRLRDYQPVFEKYFSRVEITITQRDPEAFAKTRARIYPQFLTGDPEIDCAMRIRVIAANPK